ncbi:MAG: AtpZ/AtpI family protein [Actinocrinis sp.]
MWSIVGHMVSAIAVYGGLGYLLGRWTGHPILLLFGVLFGVALSLWYTIHTVSKAQNGGGPQR